MTHTQAPMFAKPLSAEELMYALAEESNNYEPRDYSIKIIEQRDQEREAKLVAALKDAIKFEFENYPQCNDGDDPNIYDFPEWYQKATTTLKALGYND